MKFNWKNGCLPREEWARVVYAVETINSSVVIPSMGGFTKDNVNYCAVDFIAMPHELKYAVAVLNDFVRSIERS